MNTAYSLKTDAEDAIKDVQNAFAGIVPHVVLFFASSTYDPHVLSKKMQDAFPNTTVFGCSSAGEIVNGKMLKRSVVAMAFGPDEIEGIKIHAIEDLHRDNAVEDAFASFEQCYEKPMLELDPEKYVGIILVDGLSMAEERLIDRIGDLTNVVFIGGSAGDDLQFKSTYVYSNGKAYTKAALLALIKPKVGFDILKTQSFSPGVKELLATKVNEGARQVIEFDGRPAAVAYAEAIGVPVEDAPKHFMSRPVGLMVGAEPYVRSPQQIKDNTMVFYCNVKEGMKLSILESADIVQDTRKAVESKIQELGKVSGLINFHCILRTLELDDKGQAESYGKIFSDIPTIGFSTYGEQYIGHINQTSTMLIFKGSK